MRNFESAAADYGIEVDIVAARLVERGMALWPALAEAGRIVQKRRRQKAAQSGFPQQKNIDELIP